LIGYEAAHQPMDQRRTSNAGSGYENRSLSHEKSLQRMRENAIEQPIPAD
jgi:hypothetical protein